MEGKKGKTRKYECGGYGDGKEGERGGYGRGERERQIGKEI